MLTFKVISHLFPALALMGLLALASCGQPQSAATDQQLAIPSIAGPSTTGLSTNDQAVESPAAPSDHAAPQPQESASPAAETAAPPAAPATDAAKGQRPPADRAPTRPGDAEKITFDDLNLGMQADIVFREFMVTDRVKVLDGKRISIVGYMHGGQATQRGIKEFVLLKNTQCKFGPGGQADHLANIVLRADNSTAFTPSPVKVEGTLKLAPFQGPDGNTWSIYRLDDAQIR